ncbi:hypothetical protein U0070_027122 [Myodes glareolus]|uniref:Uncharacterized protein n=1 Tax=Myodes glareolus TaxID=447135 RepID=A0AAW0HT79_MYOGA
MIPGGWGTRAARCAGSTQESPRHAGRGQAGAETQRPPRAAAKLSEEFEQEGKDLWESMPTLCFSCPSVARLSPEELLSATGR